MVSNRRTTLPAIDRPDANLTIIGEWVADTTQHQHAVVDAAIDQWSRVPWPEGLLSHTAYAGEDGLSVLHYSQATGEQGFSNFAGSKHEWLKGVDAAVPGIQRRGAGAYTRKVSVRTDVAGTTACVVLVTFVADSADAATAWIEDLLSAARTEPAAPGMLSAHFHVSLDGHKVINYAEWMDAQAHQQSVDNREQRPAAAEVVDRTPSVQFQSVQRYQHWRSAHP